MKVTDRHGQEWFALERIEPVTDRRDGDCYLAIRITAPGKVDLPAPLHVVFIERSKPT